MPDSAASGWCREHDEAEPCVECSARRNIDSVLAGRDHIPTKGYDHSLCGVDPCSDCR